MPDPSREDVRQAIEGRHAWAVDTLAGLVRRPSVLGQEDAAQDEVAAALERLGFAVDTERIELARIKDLPGFSPVEWTLEGKKNVVGYHRVHDPAGRSLALNGHVDVVSPEPSSLWTSPPFEPRLVEDEEDGEAWMYGRGAGDMKGGTVSYLWALAALADMGLEPASTVVCQSPVEEECTGNGTLALLERGHLADACVIPEPFNETLLASQVGVLWFKVRVLGKTNHVLATAGGVNAIDKAWTIINAMRGLEQELNHPNAIPELYRDVPHPINLNVGVIEGGDWPSTVAGECVVDFRLGLYPGERLDELKRRIEERVREVAAGDVWLREFPPKVEYAGFQAEGCSTSLDGRFGGVLSGAHGSWRDRPPELLKATCTTDVRFFELYYDTPATCYGPKAKAIHGVDEKVSIDSMQRVAEVLTSFVARWCGLRKKA